MPVKSLTSDGVEPGACVIPFVWHNLDGASVGQNIVVTIVVHCKP